MKKEKGLSYSEVLQNNNYIVGLCFTMKFNTPTIIVIVE